MTIMGIQLGWITKHKLRGDLQGLVVDRVAASVTRPAKAEGEEPMTGTQVLIGVLWNDPELPSPSYHDPSELQHAADEESGMPMVPVADALMMIAGAADALAFEDEEEEGAEAVEGELRDVQ